MAGGGLGLGAGHDQTPDADHHEHDHLDGLLFTHRAEDLNHLVRAEEFERRHAWPPDWPVSGARNAPVREFPEGGNAYFEGVR